jgi:monofunctional biosynthetic peptidoglycan transglycosylase
LSVFHIRLFLRKVNQHHVTILGKQQNKSKKGASGFLQQVKRGIFFLLLQFIQWSLLFICLYRIVPVPLTPLHIIRLFEERKDDKETRLEKDWVAIDEMSPNMPLAVVTSEDPKFFEHFGFDFEQIKNSLERNMEKGKKLRGASTITQQTAKNLFLWPKRSWLRKGIEVYFTLAIETFWNKKRILEVYLNIIEMGDGIYGAEAAAQEYFSKSCENLSKNEAALIAAVLPNPRKWSPAKPTAYIRKKQQRIVRYMKYVDMEALQTEKGKEN